MLVLNRKPGEQIVIGDDITLTVVEVRGDRVRLAFDAPDQVRILRTELACRQVEPVGGDGRGKSRSVTGIKQAASSPVVPRTTAPGGTSTELGKTPETLNGEQAHV
jgi:carbon storage regulator CsrA